MLGRQVTYQEQPQPGRAAFCRRRRILVFLASDHVSMEELSRKNQFPVLETRDQNPEGESLEEAITESALPHI
jgi:hypothetical protein